MKRILEISKTLWLTNIVLLLILGYILVGFIFRNEQEQNATTDPNLKNNKWEIASNKDSVLIDNHKTILDRNIFGSSELSSVKEMPETVNKAPQVSVLNAQLRLLATVAGDEEVACAVIENVKTKIQDLYRTGDIIEGTHIESIERNRIVLFDGQQREVLNLYVADGISPPVEKKSETTVVEKPSQAEVVSITSPTEREINKKAFLAKVGGMEAILKMAKITPNIVNGKEKGLRIEGLENSSMAKYVGFENGDVIEVINGQTITNRRKLSEILRRARAHSSFDTQILRGTEKKTLSFRIK